MPASILIKIRKKPFLLFWAALCSFVAICSISGCIKEPSSESQSIRGLSIASADGKTYLQIVDANGGICGEERIWVDGKVWPYALHTPGPIHPGIHKIYCGDTFYPGGEIEFEISPGTTFHFDYWGP